MIGAATFGSRCRKHDPPSDAPSARAATTYSRSSRSQRLGAHEAGHGEPAGDPMSTISPASGTECQSVSTAMRSSTRGIDMNASSKRIIALSIAPPA